MPDALRVHFNQKHFAVKRWDQGGLGHLDFSSFVLYLGNLFTPPSILEKESCAQKHFEVSIPENNKSYIFNLLVQSFGKNVKFKLDLG